MTRLVRRIAACLAIAALAFAQLAISAYACPSGMEARAQAVGDLVSGDCEELANPNLCEQHCDYGSSSVHTPSAPSPAADLAPLPWRIEPFMATSAPSPARSWPLGRRADIPPLILFGVLRI